MKRLEGKIALITGGGRGIGRAIAERFAGEGAVIVLSDIDDACVTATAEELSIGGAIVKPVPMNVADEESVATAVDRIIETYGRIDVLVNNAGITRDTLMIRMKKLDWDAVINVNLTGSFLVSRAVIKHMMKARKGSVVNIASVVGVMGNAGQANYSASKAGLIGLTKTMAKEFAGRGITVNAVAPGYIETDMTAVLSDEAKEAFLRVIPLSRPGSPLDVANTVTFLASDEASYITGQVVCIDGGMVM